MKSEVTALDSSATWPPGALVVQDSVSELLRFNEESIVLEFYLTRIIPHEIRKAKKVGLCGLARGVHTESFYKRLAGAVDGTIDVRVMERDNEVKNLLRIRNLKGQPHDTRWHEIAIKTERRNNPSQSAVLVDIDAAPDFLLSHAITFIDH